MIYLHCIKLDGGSSLAASPWVLYHIMSNFPPIASLWRGAGNVQHAKGPLSLKSSSVEGSSLKVAAEWAAGGESDPGSASARMSRSKNILSPTRPSPPSLGIHCGNLRRGVWRFSCICSGWDVTLNSHTLGIPQPPTIPTPPQAPPQRATASYLHESLQSPHACCVCECRSTCFCVNFVSLVLYVPVSDTSLFIVYAECLFCL